MNKLEEHFFIRKKKRYVGVFFVTGFFPDKEEFEIGLLRNNDVITLGSFAEGLKEEEKVALIQTLTKNMGKSEKRITVNPGICIEIIFKGINNGQLLEPTFNGFRLKEHWENCTWGNLLLKNSAIEQDVNITNPSKPIWESPLLNKDSYISYLVEIAPEILPFLYNRLLTVIRFPHGVNGESFYQKSCPDYAQSFITTKVADEIKYIVCNDLSTLLWLGNQLALEFHIPFETIHSEKPVEIVFDLDPPSKEHFSAAILAAQEMKKLFDKFEISSFPKLSGNKGLQIHIPIMDRPFTYKETRVFTEFIAKYLVEKFPKEFTIERMKKNRGEKLYIDYVQHWEGKTIICPYSTRGKDKPNVAAPLLWDEVNDKLNPNDYTIITLPDRIKRIGCPFKDYNYFNETNNGLSKIISTLEQK